jgi:hypothetical protein
VDELVGVLGLAAGGRDDDVDQRRAGGACDIREAAEALGRLRQLRRRHDTVPLDVGAQPDHALAAPDDVEAVPGAGGDEQANRVRPHVDDCDVH